MFEEYISLGFDCRVASSMSKYGLRSFSSPFDWCISEFHNILKCMENNFEDFMSKDNLEELPNKPHFIDKKYGFYFSHDIENSLVDDFNVIKERYLRRIQGFRSRIKFKTCFIRALENEDELSYIKENKDYINAVIKASNEENEIIYIVNSQFRNVGTLQFPFFVMDRIPIPSSRADVRALFDVSPEVIDYLLKNYNVTKRKDNMLFDLKKEAKISEIELIRYGLLVKMEYTFLERLSISEAIMIYGAGNIGKILYRKIKKRCQVVCFIDKSGNEKEYKGIPIIRPKDLKRFGWKNSKIIITATYEYEKIKKQLHKICGNELNIQSLDDWLDTVERKIG